jgi:hypothetical protein
MANVKIDPTKTALQNLLALVDLFNTDGPSDPTQVTTSNLQTVSNVESDPTANTSIEIDATAGGKYTGSVVVYYERLALATQTATEASPLSFRLGSQTAAQVLAAVVNYYDFIPSEITAPSYAVASATGSQSMTLQASGSLVYQDGTAEINLNWTDNTLALLHFDGANGSNTFTDDTGRTWAVSAGASIETSLTKFGSGAYQNAGSTGRFPYTNDSADLHLTGDYTVEFWVNPQNGNTSQVLVIKGSGGRINLSANSLFVYDDTASASINGGSVPNNQWSHVALVKHGSTTTLYVNGTSVATSTSLGSFGNNSGILSIGAATDGTYPMYSAIDEFRISNMARYTANFTPATQEFVVD